MVPDVTHHPVFVGREPELALLDQRLAAAGQGRGSVVLLAGEPADTRNTPGTCALQVPLHAAFTSAV